MTVHMIRVAIGPSDQQTLQEANAALDTWIANHAEWVEDGTEHRLVELGTEPGGGVTYWAGTFRFELADAKADLLQTCEDKLVNGCSWYRLGYHVCDHDESSRGACA